MSIEALSQKLLDAGFERLRTLTSELHTPPLNPIEFLRQYLEGKQEPPANIEAGRWTQCQAQRSGEFSVWVPPATLLKCLTGDTAHEW